MRLGTVLLAVLAALPGCRGDSSEQVMLRARMLAGLMVEGEFGKVGVRLAPQLRRRLPPTELVQMWRDIRVRAGRIQGIEKVRYEVATAGARGVVSLRCEKGNVDLVIVFDRDGKATQISVQGLPKTTGKVDPAPPPTAKPNPK